MKSRKLVGLGALVVSLVAFVDCKGPEPRPGPDTGGSGGGVPGSGGRGGGMGGAAAMGDAAVGAVQLKITWWGSADRDMRTQKVIDLFMSKNPGIQITTEHYTSTQGMVGMGYWPTLLKHADDNTLPDIMQHDYAYIEEWTTKGRLRALDDLVNDKSINLTDVPAALVDGGKVGAKIMGITLGVNTQAMVLDVDAFMAAGIPLPNDDWTWNDFERIALEIKTKSNIWGAGTGLHGYTPGWKAVILSKDQWVWSADGKALGYTDDAPWIQHFKMLLRLQAAGAIPRRAEEPAGSNVEAQPLVMGKAAMEHIQSNQLVALWNAAGMNRNLKIMPLPKVMGGRSPIYMKPAQYFSITSACKYPKEAAKFIDFFTNDVEANKILGGERGMPISTKVLAALKPNLTKMAAESFSVVERGTAYATKLPPNDPVTWTTILTQIFGPKVVDPIMNLLLSPEEGVALFRREASQVLAGGPVPDSGVPMVSDGGAPADGAATVDAGGGGEAGNTANPMTFFVTSTGSGAMGGNLGGLAGADARCERLAAAVGAGGRGWRAFLSTTAGGGMPAVAARDRIGAGPWRNQKGQMVAANVTQLLMGVAAGMVLDEKGGTVPMMEHDILTGSTAMGTPLMARTCGNWASTMGQSQVGHADGTPAQRFSAHASGCTEMGLRATLGSGRLYCFASMAP